MKIQYGLISADSHIALDRDALTKRLLKAVWGDRIPQVVETTEKDKPVERWIVNGRIRRRAVCNCPAAMDGPMPRNKYPDRWEEVPRKAYVPQERLRALDEDRIDAEVLFPNDPGGFYDYEDPASSSLVSRLTTTRYRNGMMGATVLFRLPWCPF